MPNYAWQRFWCPRAGAFRLDAEGFLLDPEGEFGTVANPEALAFRALTGAHFLGLLGEAGSGKTQTLASEYRSAATQIAEAGGLAKHISLRDVGNGDELDHEIFNADWFRAWRSGDYALHLFLDALDEGADFYRQIASRLLNRFSDLPLQRLFVRITCRTASWPSTFDSELRQIIGRVELGTGAYAVYELLPLRRADVELAAATEGFDPQRFTDEIIKRDLVPLASKPMTLRFLIGSYQRGQTLPVSSVDIYAAGCRELATEANEARRDSRAIGKLDATQRLAIAERMAAIALLGNWKAIWMGLENQRPQTDLVPDDIRGVELLGEQPLTVSDRDIKEVLGTGLFSSRGETRFGWSHQTFGEFLAARYLNRHRFTIPQILGLISTSEDATQRVRPQLVGTAAWLASVREDVMRVLLEKDPGVLLLSDASTLGDDIREQLVFRLLEKFGRAELFDRDAVLFRLYGKLLHPGLAEQLRRAITAPDLEDTAKRQALAIAQACELKELSGLLADLALEGSAPLGLRVSAAKTLATVGDSDSKGRLLPLAQGLPEDVDDELKGASLLALWPEAAEIDVILPHLTRRKKPNLFGLYYLFICGFVEKMPNRAIPSALRWVSALEQSFSGSASFGELASEILDRAWSLANEPEIMDALPKALLNAGRLNFEKPRTNWPEPVEQRRLLIEHLVRNFKSREDAARDWPWNLAIPVVDDFRWMLSRVPESSEPHRSIWLELLSHTFQIDLAEHVDALFAAAPLCEHVKAEFESCLGSVALNSDRAERDRGRWQKRENWKKERESRRRDGKAELSKLLDLADKGSLEAWCWVPRALAITADGAEAPGLAPCDLATSPGWLAGDSQTRKRIVRTATDFLTRFDPKPLEWLDRNTWSLCVIAGMSAFLLLQSERPETLSNLSTEVWERWAPFVVLFPFFGDHPAAVMIRRAAYTNSPTAVLETLGTAIDANDRGSAWAIEHVEDYWDAPVANKLFSKLLDPGLQEGMFSKLIKKLLEQGHEKTLKVARDLITGPLPVDPTERSKVISVGVILLARDPVGTWPLIWHHLGGDEEFARGFLVELAKDERQDHRKLLESIGELQAAQLYARLSELFPYEKDRLVTGFVGPDDEGRMFRDSVLAWLQNRGTQAACDAIASMVQRMPHLPELKWVLVEAIQIRRTNAPNWPKPTEILQMAAERSRRFVRDAGDLQDVLIEALANLEKDLQGQTPTAQFLWDKVDKFVYRPKPEDALSDYTKLYLEGELRRRGVVVNREVRIHRGEKTDMLVDAVTDTRGGDPDTVTVVIETKGCWNPELLTAMKNQLVDKYLRDSGCRHGIYLVFWFECAAWDPKDSRWKRRPRFASLGKLRSTLASQAKELPGVSIRSVVVNACLKRTAREHARLSHRSRSTRAKSVRKTGRTRS